MCLKYQLPKKAVYDWWTDLSGRGYVGKALKSIRPLGREGEKLLVETKWKMMGKSMTFLEKLTLISEDQWIWEPEMFGIHITDNFTLQDSDAGVTELRIHSEIMPKGLKGNFLNLTMGWMLRRGMVKEWKAASEALLMETTGSLNKT